MTTAKRCGTISVPFFSLLQIKPRNKNPKRQGKKKGHFNNERSPNLHDIVIAVVQVAQTSSV